MAQIEAEIVNCTWNIDLLYGVMARLIARRDALREREAKARARDLKRARELFGEGVIERG